MSLLGCVHLCGLCRYQRILASINNGLASNVIVFQGQKTNNKNIISKNLHISKSNFKFVSFPDNQKVDKLLNFYPEPIKLVEDLMQPLTSVSPASQASLLFKPCLKATKWKAVLQFKDPFPLTVIGCADCHHQAKLNAYLQACEVFSHLGLICKFQTEIVPAKEIIQSSISKISKDISNFTSFQITYDWLNISSQKQWRSTLKIFWPDNIIVSAICDTLSGAEYKCYLLAIIKLKKLGLLNLENHNLWPYKWIKLPTALNNTSFNYHIYVDASNVGFGAYFFSPESSDVSWFYDNWPDFIDQEIKEQQLRDSKFIELYAMVAALYTWKHKFYERSVLCYSDNISVVSMINEGFNVLRQQKRYYKLFKILKCVSQTYHILLSAKHVQREDNVAADFLAKNKVDCFRKIVPNTREQSKKTKKLLFCLPLK